MTKIEEKVQADTKCPGTVWEYSGSSSESNKTKNLHPAPYPDKLCGDLIECFSKPDDIIFDPFLGSGTTAVMSKKLNRNFVGGDIAEQYIELAKQRINEECNSVINKIQE
jgi:DNA modification methylase